jgi:protoheme IX farnesyltransferase
VSLDESSTLQNSGLVQPEVSHPQSTLRAYVALTKPRIIELLLVTTIPTMFLAAEGFPELAVVCWTLLGGALSAGGANVLNCYFDRDIDALMHRTQARPSATGQISPRNTMTFGLILSALSVILLAVTVNALSAALSAGAIAFYVVIYTLLLKRRTSQNIVWGGAAGCMPVLIGWSAVTGSLSWTPLVLFLIVFFWTPPHYWPLSLRFKEDYARAGVPMLPVEESALTVAKQIVWYSWVLFAVSWALIPVADMGIFYHVAAVLLGTAFLVEAYGLRDRVKKDLDDLKPMRLFHWSITYLSLLFLAIGIDPFLR